MKLVRFKCNQLDCRRDFYINNTDIIELMEQKDTDELDIFCPFCDDGIGIEIEEVTFDNRSVLDADLIASLVVDSRKIVGQMEELTYKLENTRVNQKVEEADE